MKMAHWNGTKGMQLFCVYIPGMFVTERGRYFIELSHQYMGKDCIIKEAQSKLGYFSYCHKHEQVKPPGISRSNAVGQKFCRDIFVYSITSTAFV
jgi:hypothetical protein